MLRILSILSLVALAAPVSAAQVGVRHSWGNTTSHVTGGRSYTESESRGAYAERSWGGGGGGHAAGGAHSEGGSGYVRSEVGSFNSRTEESYGFNSTSTSGFSETSSFSR